MKIKEAEEIMDAGGVIKNTRTNYLYKKDNKELFFLFRGKWCKSIFGLEGIINDDFEEYDGN